MDLALVIATVVVAAAAILVGVLLPVRAAPDPANPAHGEVPNPGWPGLPVRPRGMHEPVGRYTQGEGRGARWVRGRWVESMHSGSTGVSR